MTPSSARLFGCFFSPTTGWRHVFCCSERSTGTGSHQAALSSRQRTFEQAAYRELAEETGRTSIELGPHIWNRRSVFEWRGDVLDFRERWYLARVPEVFELDVAGWTAEEQADITDHRWWSLELAAATDPMVPSALPHLLSDLLRNGAPAEPVEVGI